jgi:hypothetical protein
MIAPKQIRKITETPKNLATATVEEKIIQKPFTLHGLYSAFFESRVQEKAIRSNGKL